MAGLVRRIEALEARAAADALAEFDLAGYDSVAALAERIAGLADRYSKTVAPSIDQQSVAERVIRGALGAAAGRAGDEYARTFWQTVSAALRAYEDGRAA